MDHLSQFPGEASPVHILIISHLYFALLGEIPGLMTVVGGMIIVASIVIFGLKGK